MPPAPHEANPYDAPPQGTGRYDAGPYDAPPSGPSAYDPGRYGTDRQDPAAYDTGGYEVSGYEPGGYDSGPGSGNVGGGQYGGGGYGSSGADTGHWALPGSGSERPPLPQRRSSGPEPSHLRSVFQPAGESGAEPDPQWTPPPESDLAGAEHNRPALPRRVRQANLAPQLRDDVEPVGDATTSGERSPEELRTMLSSIQKGWLRGRSDSGQTTADDRQEDI
jgi:hypothetical protein